MQPVRVYKVSCLLLQVEVLGLAGFLYPSSGLLPWREPGRQISRTEGSYPRQRTSPLLRLQSVALACHRLVLEEEGKEFLSDLVALFCFSQGMVMARLIYEATYSFGKNISPMQKY
jgi:hypothetical protein